MTGRPVTAQEAIAETLAPLVHAIWCEDDLCRPDHGTIWILPDLSEARGLAAAVVEAVRALPADQRAELIGGKVERHDVPLEVLDTPEGTKFRVRRDERIVTPWAPAVQGQAHIERSE